LQAVVSATVSGIGTYQWKKKTSSAPVARFFSYFSRKARKGEEGKEDMPVFKQDVRLSNLKKSPKTPNLRHFHPNSASQK